MSSRQIEAARRAMTNYLKRGGKVWIRIFPDKPVTQKPAETRMGSGKGNPEYWVAVVKPGRMYVRGGWCAGRQAEEALRRAAMKMPMDCRFIERQHDWRRQALVRQMDERRVQPREVRWHEA